MLLNSVIIVLREVLEAALLFSVLLALAKQSAINQSWFSRSLLMGGIGAAAYGLNMGMVTEWFDGVGQEVINALIQLIIYCLLVVFISLQFKLHLILKYEQEPAIQKLKSLLVLLMILLTTLALSREGAEILLYLLSVARSENHISSTLIGMIIGASIGISIGFLFYYLLLSLSRNGNMIIALSLLVLVSSGLIAQATQLLIQADWIPAQLPLWDSSFLLSEESIAGELMYALLGYESHPTAIQAIVYLCGILLPCFLILYIWKKRH